MGGAVSDPTETPPTKAPGGMGDIRSWVTVALILGFFAAYTLNALRNDNEAMNLMNGALIAAFAGAWGYWLGSSSASSAKDATITTLATKGPQ